MMLNHNIVEILPLLSESKSDGPSYSVIRLCESLALLDLKIELLNCYCNPITAEHAFLKRFPLGFGPQRLCRSPSMYKWLEYRTKQSDISLIHSHGLWTMPNIYPWRISRKYAIPIVVSPRGSLAPWAFKSGSFVKKIFWPIYQKRVLKNAACLHATAKSEYEDIRRMGFTQPVAIIPNGIDIPQLLTATAPKFRTLLFLARINPIKGLDMLLPAWQAVQDKFPQWQLQIVGPDSRGYLQTVKQMAIDLQLKRIEFSGLLTGDAKFMAYQNAELFILPSYTENFGMSIAEAMASGTPVITTKGTPWSELESHGAGWWVDINLESLILCLETALDKPQSQLAAMGQSGRDWMIKNFSWGKVGQMMKETYEWVLNGGIPPSWVCMD